VWRKKSLAEHLYRSRFVKLRVRNKRLLKISRVNEKHATKLTSRSVILQRSDISAAACGVVCGCARVCVCSHFVVSCKRTCSILLFDCIGVRKSILLIKIIWH